MSALASIWRVLRALPKTADRLRVHADAKPLMRSRFGIEFDAAVKPDNYAPSLCVRLVEHIPLHLLLPQLFVQLLVD